MHHRQPIRILKSASFWACCLGVACLGTTCPFLGGEASPFPTPIEGNTAPRMQLTNVITDFGNNFVQQGDPVIIQFNGSDSEDTAVARVFASQSANPTADQQISILEGFEIGPGFGSGVAQWDTTGVPIGAYNIFGEIEDGTFNPLDGSGNAPVRVTFVSVISVAPRGSQPLNSPPRLTFLEPLANLGLSVQDEVTVRYIYADNDSPEIKVTLLLDKDRIPTNDDVGNPGDPLNPATNIIILPSTARLLTDPTFDGDPAPPVDPAQLQSADSLEVRTNPRTFGPTVPGLLPFPGAPQDGEFKEYRFTIDFAQIPVRTQPYFLRATITDGVVTAHGYATGSITISSLASGLVDVGTLGFSFSGSRFQGFSTGENLGSQMLGATDLDGDGVEDFLFAGRYASPRNRFQAGAAYLIFGRRKTPFPLDTNDNGIPDVPGPGDGAPIDFPAPPAYLPNPYDAVNVGRFGGIVSINSVSSFFRGTTYGMPRGIAQTIPPALQDPQHPLATTAGLTSISRLDISGDGIRDLVFGLPYVGGATDLGDDDPVEGGCDLPYSEGFPNGLNCSQQPANDDIGFSFGGHVIMVDGTNNLVTAFPQFVDAGIAGQFDPLGAADDEGFVHGAFTIPVGARLRGAYLDENATPAVIDNQYGNTVGVLPGFQNNPGDSLVVSSPGFDLLGQARCGKVEIFQPNNFILAGWTLDGVRSFPVFGVCPGGACAGMDPTICCRSFVPMPNFVRVYGAQGGDELGYAGPAGQFNQDGVADVMMGAPGSDRRITAGGPILTDNGVFYVLFTPAGGFGNSLLTVLDPDMPPGPNVPLGPPRIEVRGSHNGDRFGEIHAAIEDMNGGGFDDVAFASPSYDDFNIGIDAGYVGVIFGNRPLTGENGFTPEQVGTASLAGIRFIGAQAGARAGTSVASAGDFNRDGYGDLLIACPGETRVVGGVARKGVAYLVFGGTHLNSNNNGQGFNLAQVGVQVGNSIPLPGIVFVSRFAQGTIDEAPLDSVGGFGDIDGDGFDDIGVAATTADFVNLASPNQRRDDAGEVYIIYGNNFGTNNLGG